MRWSLRNYTSRILAGLQRSPVPPPKWQALVIWANQVDAFDLDDIDDEGKLIAVEDEQDDDEVGAPKPARRPWLRDPNLRRIKTRNGATTAPSTPNCQIVDRPGQTATVNLNR